MSSVTLLGSSQMQKDMTGDPIKADGWYGYPDGLHTIAIVLANFIGRIYIEGTLSSNPSDCDWFPIKLHPNQTNYYLEFPIDPNSVNEYNGGDSGVFSYTFKVFCLYLRARVERSYFINLTTQPSEIELLGQVRQILLSL